MVNPPYRSSKCIRNSSEMLRNRIVRPLSVCLTGRAQEYYTVRYLKTGTDRLPQNFGEQKCYQYSARTHPRKAKEHSISSHACHIPCQSHLSIIHLKLSFLRDVGRYMAGHSPPFRASLEYKYEDAAFVE